jgi:rRNA-processing protein FCF1
MPIQSIHSNDDDKISSPSYSSRKYHVEDISAIVDGTYHGSSSVGLAVSRRHRTNEIETSSSSRSSSSNNSINSKRSKHKKEKFIDSKIIGDKSSPTSGSVLASQKSIDDELLKSHFSGSDNAGSYEDEDMMMDIEYEPPVLHSPIDNSIRSSSSPLTAVARGSLVIDTNFLVSHLDFVEQLAGLLLHIRTTAAATPAGQLTIVIPWTVLQELDSLKANPRKSKTVQNQARRASNWIFETLASKNTNLGLLEGSPAAEPIVVGQKLTESITTGLDADDAILDCCNYLHEMKGRMTVILTNDRNLCNKALVHDIRTVSHCEQLTVEAVVEVVMTELSQRWEAGDMVMTEQAGRTGQSGANTAGENINNDDDEQSAYNKIDEKLRGANNGTELLTVISNTLVAEIWAVAHAILRVEFNDVDYKRYIIDSREWNPASAHVNLATLTELLSKFRMNFSDYLSTARPDYTFLGRKPPLSGTAEDCARVLKFVYDWGIIWIQLQSGLAAASEQRHQQSPVGIRSKVFVQAVIDLLQSYIRGQ